MGSAFTIPCADNNNEVTLVGTHLENELITSIKKNKKSHPSLKTNLSSKINIERFDNLKSTIEKGVDVIVAGISSVGIFPPFILLINSYPLPGSPGSKVIFTLANCSLVLSGSRMSAAILRLKLLTNGKGWAGSTANGVRIGKIAVLK